MRAFWRGVASILDLFGVPQEPDLPKTDAEAFQRDADALRGDWDSHPRHPTA